MMGFDNIAVSSGSACTSASLEPSYVLKSLGVGEELATVRSAQPGPLHDGGGNRADRGPGHRDRPAPSRHEPAAELAAEGIDLNDVNGQGIRIQWLRDPGGFRQE